MLHYTHISMSYNQLAIHDQVLHNLAKHFRPATLTLGVQDNHLQSYKQEQVEANNSRYKQIWTAATVTCFKHNLSYKHPTRMI